jgi:hypothetical protein
MTRLAPVLFLAAALVWADEKAHVWADEPTPTAYSEIGEAVAIDAEGRPVALPTSGSAQERTAWQWTALAAGVAVAGSLSVLTFALWRRDD